MKDWIHEEFLIFIFINFSVSRSNQFSSNSKSSSSSSSSPIPSSSLPSPLSSLSYSEPSSTCTKRISEVLVVDFEQPLPHCHLRQAPNRPIQPRSSPPPFRIRVKLDCFKNPAHLIKHLAGQPHLPQFFQSSCAIFCTAFHRKAKSLSNLKRLGFD